MLFAACSDAEAPPPGASPPTTPADGLPAGYLRTSDGGGVAMLPGTHCWEGACVDLIGPRTNVEPYPLLAGEAVGFSFDPGRPDTLRVDWYEAPAPPAPADDALTWTELPPPPAQVTGTRVPGVPGRYVLTVFARWAEGEISYALYVEVRDAP